MSINTLDLVTLAVAAAEEKKANNVKTLHLSELSIITDYFIICSASNTTQVKAIADNVELKLKEQDIHPLRREGMREGHWILLDYGVMILHVFLEEERSYYNLERLWGDAKQVRV